MYLDEQSLRERDAQMEDLRRYQAAAGRERQEAGEEEAMDLGTEDSNAVAGVDRNDPILQWTNLHTAVVMK